MNATKKNITVQLEPELVSRVDELALAMDLNRSQYFRRLLRRELGITLPEVQPMLPALNGHAKAEVAA